MGAFVIRRVFWALFLFLAATIITYLIFFVIPADPAALACGKACNADDVKRVAHFLNLDEPVWKQDLHFLCNLVGHQSLGHSFVSRQPVRYIIGQDAPVTASLVFGGALFWLSLSIPVGVLSALKPRSILDRMSMTFVLVGISALPVCVGLILSYVFGYQV